MKCRHCRSELRYSFVDLGSSPLSNAYLSERTKDEPEIWYPLKVMVCDSCWLVQTIDFVGKTEIFSDEYAYFSSVSTSWLQHARDYVREVTSRLGLTEESFVIEVAANDGYLLQYLKADGVPCLGIEPTHSTAIAARNKGIDVVEEFFGSSLAIELVEQNKQADLIIANNVLAHVPDINDFVKGFSILLKPDAVATFEFPHLVNLIEGNQFDTIYHEHYSYLSLMSVQAIFKSNGLQIFDVELIPTHGGSLRIYARRNDVETGNTWDTVEAILEKEKSLGIDSLATYKGFQNDVETIKSSLLSFLLKAKREKKSVIGYGAAAKGNTLMNYCGIRRDLISYVVDKSASKIGKYMPGNHLPIKDKAHIVIDKPSYIVVFPWNIQKEIVEQLSYVRGWGAQFVTAIPSVTIR